MKKPQAGQYAAIFTRQRTDVDEGYAQVANRMVELAESMPGFVAFESAENKNGFGVTISYWESEEAIANWKRQAEHLAAQAKGKSDWYQSYDIRVAKIERAYSWPKER